MRTLAGFQAALAACLLLLLASLASPQQTRPVAFVDVTVVPMDRERLIPNQTVIVRDGRVEVIRNTKEIDVPRGATTINGHGRYLLPGLAEMHAHLPAPPTSQQVIDNVLYLFIANGVTVVRGMMGHPSHVTLRDRVASGQLLGPSLYVAGPPLETKVVPDPETARNLVRAQAAQRFDLIKVIDMRADVYAAVMDTAKDLRIPVAGHVPRSVGVRGAMAAGQVSIEHLDGYLEASEIDNSPIRNADFATRSRELPFFIDASKIKTLVADARDRGVWNVPTLGTYEIFFSPDRGDVTRMRHPEVRYLPKAWVDDWSARKDEFLDPSRNVMGFATTGPGAAKLLQLRRELVKSLHDGGAKLLVGTDALQLFVVPGFSVHTEMALMAESGLSPYEVLEAATRNVAEYFGQLSEFGTIAVGKRADFLLLEANPLENVSNTSRRAGVMIRGRWIPETEIQKRLMQISLMNGR